MKSSNPSKPATETQIHLSSVSDEEYKIALNKSIKEFNRMYTSDPKKLLKKAEKKNDSNYYDNLLLKVRRKEKMIQKLEEENAILLAQIQICESKIKTYPKIKKRYDKLTKSLEIAHEIESSPKKKKVNKF